LLRRRKNKLMQPKGMLANIAIFSGLSFWRRGGYHTREISVLTPSGHGLTFEQRKGHV